MSEFLYHYKPVEPSTWFYLSSLLMIGLFFKFGRFWSVRNLDLALLIALGPGLLLVYYGRETELNQTTPDLTTNVAVVPSEVQENAIPDSDSEASAANSDEDSVSTDGHTELTASIRAQRLGYLWLFLAGGLILCRMLADPTMVRRPLLEPNLSVGGLAFIGCSLFIFLTANVINRSPEDDPLRELRTPAASDSASTKSTEPPSQGPGYALLQAIPIRMQKVLAISSHLMIVVGLVLIGYWHFDNIVMGVGAATLYLMMPYTTILTGHMEHALPACFIVLAVLLYRHPVFAGVFLAIGGGLVYYPLFLAPLWLSYYWSRGLLRFVIAYVVTLLVLACILLIPSTDRFQEFCQMFGIMKPNMTGLLGVWEENREGWSPFYRIPVLSGFVVLASTLALWPAQKNLGTLLSCSTAVLVASQFWHGFGGGLYIGWYLPLLLLAIFRPNLEDRIAQTVVKNLWIPRRFRLDRI